MYEKITRLLSRFMKPAAIFKMLFNLSPMYRRSTGRIVSVSDDLMHVQIRIPLNFKNRNYVGSVFGGSLFSATDPIYMIQLVQILGKGYVVWDKAAHIHFKKPARETVYATFEFTPEEIAAIRGRIAQEHELTFEKQVDIIAADGTICCVIQRDIYIADKAFYKNKQQARVSKD
jgi:acyl-coenzyme A thioesterase PaaI-like protein